MEPKLYVRLAVVTVILLIIAFGIPRLACGLSHETYVQPSHLFQFEKVVGRDVQLQNGTSGDKDPSPYTLYIVPGDEQEAGVMVMQMRGLLKGRGAQERAEILKGIAGGVFVDRVQDSLAAESNHLGDGFRVTGHAKPPAEKYTAGFVVAHKDDLYLMCLISPVSMADVERQFPAFIEKFQFDPPATK